MPFDLFPDGLEPDFRGRLPAVPLKVKAQLRHDELDMAAHGRPGPIRIARDDGVLDLPVLLEDCVAHAVIGTDFRPAVADVLPQHIVHGA